MYRMPDIIPSFRRTCMKPKFLITPHFVIPNDVGDYLYRWFITPWSNENLWFRKTLHRGLNAYFRGLHNYYIHCTVGNDNVRALHCHPWDNISIVLKGGYWEHVFQYPPVEGKPLPETFALWRAPGSIIRRGAESSHALELNEDGEGKLAPSWSIFITKAKRRDWGFWDVDENGNAKWVINEEYLAKNKGAMA